MATPSLTRPDVETMSAEDVIGWAAGEFGERLCLTCSWQKQSSVLVHMVSELGLGIDVIELDTHLFFRESYETRQRLVERYGLNLIVPEIPIEDLIFEAPTKASQAWFVRQFGPNVNLGNIPPEEVIPLETLRLGLRGDTLKEVLLGGRQPASTA